MTDDEEKKFESFLLERNTAFENDDIRWARKMLPGASSDDVVHMAFHKAREACSAVSAIKRAESAAWLRERGLQTMKTPSEPSP